MIETKKMYWKYAMVLLTIFFIVTIVLNSIIRESFYSQSLEFIKHYQSKSNNNLNNFMNILSILVNTNYLIAILAVIYISHKAKLTSLVFLSYFLGNVYLMNVLKLSYQEPRPFWYSKQIQELEWGCPNQFGNPSGHSWMVVLMYEPLITDFIGPGWYRLAYIFPIIVAILVPISRMYLGVHAGNEVVMGLTLGIIMCAMYRIKLQQWFYNLFGKLDSKKIGLWGLIGIAGVNCVVIIVPIIIHSVTLTNRPIPQIFLDNLNKACNKSYDSPHIQAGALQSHAIINIIFGFLFGSAASGESNYFFFTGQWMFTSIKCLPKVLKFIFKLIMQILISVPAAAVLCFIIPKTTHISPYLKYFFASLGYWLFGFILIAFSNTVLIKCNIIIHYAIQGSAYNDKIRTTKPLTQNDFIEK